MAEMWTKIILFFMFLGIALSRQPCEGISKTSVRVSKKDCSLNLSLQYEGSDKYLAFIREEITGGAERFALKVNGYHRNGSTNHNIEQFNNPNGIYTGEVCQWNIMTINREKITVFGRDIKLIQAKIGYQLHRQKLIINSENKMLWKVCTTLDNCSLPIPKYICKNGQPPQVTNENEESEPSIEKLDVFLGASCFLLTIVVMILTIYIIREKREHPRETSSKVPLTRNHEEAGPSRSFNQPSQNKQQNTNPTNPNEHIYEEIDESKTSNLPSKSEVKKAGPSNPKEHIYKKIDESKTSNHPSKSEDSEKSKSSSHPLESKVTEAGPSNPKEHIYEEIDESKCSIHFPKADVKEAGPSNSKEPIYEEFDESKLPHHPSKHELQEADHKGIHKRPRYPSEHESVNSLYGVVLQQDN